MKDARLRWIIMAGVLAWSVCSAAQMPVKQAATPPAPVELDADRTPSIVTKGSCFIRGGALLTVTQGVIKNGDILIRDGKIVDIGANLTPPSGVTVIDATGKIITPGLI